MKTLIVYDSIYGNTEKIARAIAGAIAGEVKVVKITEANPHELDYYEMLIVGSPTHGGRPTPAVKEFIAKLPPDALKGKPAAAFDTGISSKGKGVGIKLLTGMLGYAAGRIGEALKARGARLIVPPEGFIVIGNEGPLKEGELERATGWGKAIAKA